MRPSVDGETPSFPGLRADARNILVAPQGLIYLREKKTNERTNPISEALARLFACLSHELALSESITIRTTRERNAAYVSLTPPAPDAPDLSRFYDAAAAASALSDGILYIGHGRAFIRYRDSGAARGYDAADVQLLPGDELFMLDLETTRSISPSSLTELSLQEVLLRMRVLAAREIELPERAFALVATALYRMVARYLRDHHLRYRIARFHTPQGETLTLFEILPRGNAPTGAHVPAFVLSYLENLPRSIVLTEAVADASRRMLVQWGRRYPGNPRHVLPAFAPDSLLLFNANDYYPNLSVTPMPTFFEGDDVTRAQTPQRALVGLRPLNDKESLPFELAVRLVEDTGAMPQTSALIFDEEETKWMQRLLYRLPGEAFSAYTLCLGDERAVLLGEGRPIESLPFGIPLQRVQDTQLFIPLRTRFAPDLPWALLAQALELKDGIYTFLAEEFRMDIARSSFTPLSRALVAEKVRRPQAVIVSRAQGWPELKWKPRPQTKQSKQSWRSTREPGSGVEQSESQRQGFFGRIMGERPTQSRRSSVPSNVPRRTSQRVQPPSEPIDEAALFRQRGESFLQAGDHLSAAFCFALAGDNYNAARSFQEAARRIKEDAAEREEAAS
jgi:hypothetical protein